MMLGVSRRVHDVEVPAIAEWYTVSLVQDPDTFLVHRLHRSPFRSEPLLAEHRNGGRPEALRPHQVPGAASVHSHSRVRKPLRHLAGTPGVVEMDVRHHERCEIVDAEGVEHLDEMSERCRRTNLDEHPIRGVEEVARQTFGFAFHEGIDRVEVVTDFESTRMNHGATLGSVTAARYVPTHSRLPRKGASMGIDSMNLVVLNGTLAAPAEVRRFESGSRLIRYLLTVRSYLPRRRVDVIPVTLWDPPETLVETPPDTGAPLWITGSVQRRFWEGVDGRRSRLEIVALHVADAPDASIRF